MMSQHGLAHFQPLSTVASGESLIFPAALRGTPPALNTQPPGPWVSKTLNKGRTPQLRGQPFALVVKQQVL